MWVLFNGTSIIILGSPVLYVQVVKPYPIIGILLETYFSLGKNFSTVKAG
jgi:hypothetical protein